MINTTSILSSILHVDVYMWCNLIAGRRLWKDVFSRKTFAYLPDEFLIQSSHNDESHDRPTICVLEHQLMNDVLNYL